MSGRAWSRTLLAAGGLASQAAAQLLAAMLLARSLSTEEFGAYSLAVGVAAPMVLLVGMQLHVIAATNVDGRVNDGDLARFRLLTVIPLGVAVTGILAFAPTTRSLLWLVAAQVGWRSVDLIGEYVAGLRQRDGRFRSAAAGQALRSILAYGCLVGAVLAEGPLWLGMALGGIVASAVVTLGDLRMVASRLRIAPDPATGRVGVLPRLGALYGGLGVAAMLDSLVFNLPRYVVELAGGSAEVARFSIGVYPVMLGGVAASAVAVAVRPSLAKQYASSRAQAVRASWRLVLGALGVGAGLAVVGALVGAPLLGLLFGVEYADLGRELVILLVGAALWYVAGFANSAVVASGLLRGQVRVFTWSALAALGGASGAVLAGSGPSVSGAIGVASGMTVRAALSVVLLRSVARERERV